MTETARHKGAALAYRLRKLDIGVVIVDATDFTIRSIDPIAAALLGEPAIGTDILALHPPDSRLKIEWLLHQTQPASLIAIMPTQTLLVRTTPLVDAAAICLLLCKVPEGSGAEAENPAGDEAGKAPSLLKLPVSTGQGMSRLLDLDDIWWLKAQGHYTTAYGPGGDNFCPLPMADLEARLDTARFVRVHRSFIVHLKHASAFLQRDGQHFLVVGGSAEGHQIPVSRKRVEVVKHLLAV